MLTNGLRAGLQSQQHADYLSRYGRNEIVVVVESWFLLLVREIFHPFFVFQVYSVILWMFEYYYIYASVIAFMVIVTVATTLVELRSNKKALSKMAKFECQVKVLRQGRVEQASSSTLVPGDVVVLDAAGPVPADMALLRGSVVVNECNLTGESTPVVKFPLEFSEDAAQGDKYVEVGEDQRCTIFSSTTILQVKRKADEGPVVAMVVRTGFATFKGNLILSILFPKPSAFKFVEQSLKFTASLFLMACIGFGLAVWQLIRWEYTHRCVP